MRATDWIAVVNAVKAIFNGPLTYGSNHGVETDQILWWDHLDYIGIDAYYALSSTPNPPLSSIIQAWNDIIPVLAAYSELWQRPIIFCEIGYRSTSLAAVEPWDFNGNEPADLQAQVNLYQVRFRDLIRISYVFCAFRPFLKPSSINSGLLGFFGGPGKPIHTIQGDVMMDIHRLASR